MKIRIKGNSVRVRLTRSEVAELCSSGIIWETTAFPSGTFRYTVELSSKVETLTADLYPNKIALYLPFTDAKPWPENEVVGFENEMELPSGEKLHLLLEKDFTCLESRGEDESDQYPNPKASL